MRLAPPLPERAEPLIVRLVQPNASQKLKWRPDLQQVFFDRLLAATEVVSDPVPDVTIWPEAAVPFVLGYADALQAEAAAAAGPDTTLILGIRRLDATPERENWFNSLAVLRPDGSAEAVYDKHLLVPFGEYIPAQRLIARLGLPALTTLTRGGFTAGPGPHLVSAGGLPPFLPLICYEAIFPHLMNAPEGRAGWIVHVTNDGWFGEASGPWQHFAQARSRAIEQGLPMARAANTGISAMIDPRGEVTARLGLGVQGHVDALLPAALPATIYSQYGDVPIIAAILIVLALTYINFYSGVFSRSGS
jgi:apolipoprotein N-acyltransferase